MATDVELVNAALAEIGEEPIERFVETGNPESEVDPGDDVTAKVSRIYPMVKANLLNEYPWSWLIRSQYLQEAQTGIPASAIYPYRWSFPFDASTLREVRDATGITDNPEDARTAVEGWRIQGQHMFTYFKPVIVFVQADDIDESAFPKLIENIMVLKLAARFAIAIPCLLYTSPSPRD